MKTGLIALFSALFISSVAIYFSVAGIAAVFSAYAISAIVMGTAIELGKLAGVVWLHHNWDNKDTVWWLKYGLMTLCLGVMFITSAGIFGYLSKSHIEQTAQSQESVAQIQRIDTEIARHNAIIENSERKIKKYEEGGSGADAAINAQIDKEQQRIDSAYERVKPVIQTQRDIIAKEEEKIAARIKPYQDEIDQINADLKAVEDALKNKQIKTAQRIIGTNDDGDYGSKTITALQEYRAKKEKRRKELLWKIDQIKKEPNATITAAQQEIARINASVKEEIAQSQKTINSLRARLGKQDQGDVETLIATERNRIKESNTELDTLTQEKYKLQATSRKLEAEVGPIKYIAELIYGVEADQNLLEKAVKWFIILIIFVFDPFAVLLLIAAQHSFSNYARQTGQKVNTFGLAAPTPEVDTVIKEQVDEYVEEQLDEPKGESPVWFDENFVPSAVEEIKNTLKEREDFDIVTEKEIEDIKSEPWRDLKELDDLAQEIKDRQGILMTKVGENYINFNGKVFRTRALIESFPEYNFDFRREVPFGEEFPERGKLGDMFIRTDKHPTQLYLYANERWNRIDKNVLEPYAYGRDYIEELVKKLGSGQYNPELLNQTEARHIEYMLSQEE